MKKLYYFLLLLTLQFSDVFAQAAGDQVEMADALRQNGKIYVVVVVVTIIFTGLLFYIYSLDRKIGKLEKEINSKNQYKA